MSVKVGDLVRIKDGPKDIGIVLFVYEKYDAPYDIGSGLEQLAKVMWHDDFHSVVDIDKIEIIGKCESDK